MVTSEPKRLQSIIHSSPWHSSSSVLLCGELQLVSCKARKTTVTTRISGVGHVSITRDVNSFKRRSTMDLSAECRYVVTFLPHIGLVLIIYSRGHSFAASSRSSSSSFPSFSTPWSSTDTTASNAYESLWTFVTAHDPICISLNFDLNPHQTLRVSVLFPHLTLHT